MPDICITIVVLTIGLRVVCKEINLRNDIKTIFHNSQCIEIYTSRKGVIST